MMEKGIEPTQGGKQPKKFIRRKSVLPTDPEMTTALRQYNTVDPVLPSSTET